MRNMLTAALLRFHAEFICVTEQHPNCTHEDNSRYPAVHSPNQALLLSKVDGETFDCWCEEVRDGFGINNILAVPIKFLPREISRGVKVDPQSLFDHHNDLVNSCHGLFAQKMNLEDNVSQLRLDVVCLIRRSDGMEAISVEQNELLARLANALEVACGKEEIPYVETPPVAGVMMFSDGQKRCWKDFTLKDMFTHFFADQCFEGHEMEKNNSDFKKMLPSARNTIKNQCNRLKKTIKTMLCFSSVKAFPAQCLMMRPASFCGNVSSHRIKCAVSKESLLSTLLLLLVAL